MEEKKTVWGRAKANWFWFLAGIVVAFWAFWVKGAADFAVVFNDWVKCKMMALPCLNSRWEVIKFISCGIIIGVLLLFITVMLGRRIARIKNSGMKKVKIFWKEYMVPSWQIVRKVLVVGFLFLIGALGLLLFALLIAVLFDACIECWAKIVLGISEDIKKRDVIEFIGWGITGILAFFGAVAINSRAEAQVKTAESQLKTAEAQVENNRLIEKGHVQERFKMAFEYLRSEELTTRILSFSELSYLARDNKEWRERVNDVLCARLRHLSTDKKHSPKARFVDVEEKIPEEKPSEEVQSLLGALFLSEDDRGESIFAGLSPNLQKISLVKANLRKANLQNVDMEMADLRGADLRNVDLQGARLSHARLRKAWLHSANLQGASLFFAELINTILYDANLQSVDLQGAKLQKAKLQDADLRGADLHGATFLTTVLAGADLRGVNLQDTDLQDTNLQGANLQGAKLQGAVLQKVRLQYADLRGADLRGAYLQGADLREVGNLETVNLSKAKVKSAKPPKGFQWPVDVDTTTGTGDTSDD